MSSLFYGASPGAPMPPRRWGPWERALLLVGLTSVVVLVVVAQIWG
jgi:hypothetical protein